MENNFAGKTACSLSYPGAGGRWKIIPLSSSNLGTGFTRECLRFRENFASIIDYACCIKSKMD
jgi:hypothetical protein